jgi:hypothetical protein
MGLRASIFLDFNLPNAATWFYFSALLAIALLFKFRRFLSVRNWDVVTLFLLVPGLLLLQEAHNQAAAGAAQAVAGAALGLATPATGIGSAAIVVTSSGVAGGTAGRLVWFGYLWLLCGSAYFLVRCLVDLALIRRPALSPNLNLSGLAWLGGTLFVCLVAVAVRHRDPFPETVGKRSVPVDETQRGAERLVNQSREIASGNRDSAGTSFWVERILAMLCHLAVIAGLLVSGRRHFQDVHAGMAAATFYLLLPYTAIHVSQIHHVLPAALLVWAVAAYRRPWVSGLLLGLAAGASYFPALLLPVWLSFYRRNGAGRFAGAFLVTAGLCLALMAGVLWMDDQLLRSWQSVRALPDWQPWKEPGPDTEGFWTGVHWAYRLPVFIAYVAFVATTLFWPAPKDLAHLLALSAAVLIGIQFWFADRGGVYVLWYLPLLLLLVFRPNLSDRRAIPIPSEGDWLVRLQRAARERIKRRLKLRQPLAPVH